jgi:cytochrome P450
VTRLLVPEAWHPFDVDPRATYETLHRQGGWHWSDLLQSWVVSDFPMAAAVLKDHATFASDPRRAGSAVSDAAVNLQLLDPPAFNSVHRVMVKLLRPSTVHSGRDVARAFLSRYFDRLGPTGEFEGVHGLGIPLASAYMNEVLGLGSFDLSALSAIAPRIIDGMDSMFIPEHEGPARSARRECAALITTWIGNSPVGSPLQQAAEAAQLAGVSELVFTNSLRAILLSSFTSLPSALASVLYEGASRSADYGAWIDGGLASSGLEEILRLHPPFQATSRFATVDTVIADQEVKRGEPVTVLIKAANLDPGKFTDPYALRAARNEGKSLSFGYGVHACAGSALATDLCGLLIEHLSRERVTLGFAGTPTRAEHATVQIFGSLPLVACSAGESQNAE